MQRDNEIITIGTGGFCMFTFYYLIGCSKN